MSDQQGRPQPHQPKAAQPQQLSILDLDTLTLKSEYDVSIVASVKHESQETRKARERQEQADQAHGHKIELIKTILASTLALILVAVSVYMLAFKSNATETETRSAVAILLIVVTAGIKYVFGKAGSNTQDKE
jgi:ABC-type transport system involved in cytochrome bd biosynthesis fused ATPase/permease subunit